MRSSTQPVKAKHVQCSAPRCLQKAVFVRFSDAKRGRKTFRKTYYKCEDHYLEGNNDQNNQNNQNNNTNKVHDRNA